MPPVSTEGGSPTDRLASPSKPQVDLPLFVSRPVLPACSYGEPPDERRVDPARGCDDEALERLESLPDIRDPGGDAHDGGFFPCHLQSTPLIAATWTMMRRVSQRRPCRSDPGIRARIQTQILGFHQAARSYSTRIIAVTKQQRPLTSPRRKERDGEAEHGTAGTQAVDQPAEQIATEQPRALLRWPKPGRGGPTPSGRY